MSDNEKLQAQFNLAEKAFKSSDAYHELRPDYSFQCVEYILLETGVLSQDQATRNDALTVLELGCGTGLFTQTAQRVLKDAVNVRYIASDPLESMRTTFLQSLPDVEIFNFKAENIPLPDNSVHTVLAPASLHWFANQEAFREMYRVLEPNGMLGYIIPWPTETDDFPWVKEINKLIYESYEKTKAPQNHDMKWIKELDKSGLFHEVKSNFMFKIYQRLTQQQCVTMFASYGGVKSGGDDHVKEFEKKVDKILTDNFSGKGIEFEGVDYTVEIYTSRSKKLTK